MSIVYRSTKGSKLTSNEVDGNFQYLENLIGGNGNVLVTQTGFTLVGQNLTIASGWVWKILNNTYTNASSVVVTIPFAATGKTRIDLVVANQSNTFVRVAGVESTSNPVAPSLPSNTILVTFYEVTDGVVLTPTDPIIGSTFKKKTENLGFGDPSLSGTNAVIQLRPDGTSYYAFSNASLVSIDGFGLSLITGVPTAETPYPMKDLFIENTGTTPFALKHDGAGAADVKFFFTDETDLIVPVGGKLWLKYGNPYCQLFFKSWENAINSESRTIANRWELVNSNEYYRSRADYAGFNAETINVSTTISTGINQTVASLSAGFYRTSKSKKISKIFIDGSNMATGITSLKLGVFAFQRAAVTDPNFSAVNLINLGEFTITKTSGVTCQSWELTPSNIEIPTNYLVSCVLMKTDGTGSQVNLGIDFKFEDYAV
jgi:hypothetical protein